MNLKKSQKINPKVQRKIIMYEGKFIQNAADISNHKSSIVIIITSPEINPVSSSIINTVLKDKPHFYRLILITDFLH